MIFHGRYIFEELVPDPNVVGDFFEQDSLVLGSRLRWGISSTFFLSLEGSYIYTDPVDRATDSYYVYALGTNFKLTDGNWLEVSGGTNSERDNQSDEGFVLATLKWGLTPKPKFEIKK